MRTAAVLLVAVLGAGGIVLGAREESREEAVTRLMKDMRSAYKSLKQAVKDREWGRMEGAVAKMSGIVSKMPPLAPEGNPGPFTDTARTFRGVLRDVDADVHGRNIDRVHDDVGKAADTCRACHAHYRNAFARMIDNLFLY